MSTASCLYEGSIRHSRLEPPVKFAHPLVLAYLDLAELPELLAGRLVSSSVGVVRFRRSDYYGDPSIPLDRAIRDLVSRHTGRRPAGPVRLLTGLRSFGLCFNPVSFYYCLDHACTRIDALVAEVTNTPWGERQAYVIEGGTGRLRKALHVSPFMDMDHTYACSATLPDGRLTVRLQSWKGEKRAFEAGLALRRRELTPASLRRVTMRYPFGSLRVLALIYLHALGLRLAGAEVFPHPRHAS